MFERSPNRTDASYMPPHQEIAGQHRRRPVTRQGTTYCSLPRSQISPAKNSCSLRRLHSSAGPRCPGFLQYTLASDKQSLRLRWRNISAESMMKGMQRMLNVGTTLQPPSTLIGEDEGGRMPYTKDIQERNAERHHMRQLMMAASPWDCREDHHGYTVLQMMHGQVGGKRAAVPRVIHEMKGLPLITYAFIHRLCCSRVQPRCRSCRGA